MGVSHDAFMALNEITKGHLYIKIYKTYANRTYPDKGKLYFYGLLIHVKKGAEVGNNKARKKIGKISWIISNNPVIENTGAIESTATIKPVGNWN